MAGAHQETWENRTYFSSMRPLIAQIAVIDSECEPNYLRQHIGVARGEAGESFNFVAFKGSRHHSFSIELKLGRNAQDLRELPARWQVDPYNNVAGFRVHLPENISAAEYELIRSLMAASYDAWLDRRAS